LLSITNSTAGPSLDYYYFFYEWVAEPLPVECASERVPVTVTVGEVDGLTEESTWNVVVHPNPCNAGSTLTLTGLEGSMTVEVLDAQGRIVHEGSSNGSVMVDWPAGWYAVRIMNNRGSVRTFPLTVR
jgi:hypothetical protein